MMPMMPTVPARKLLGHRRSRALKTLGHRARTQAAWPQAVVNPKTLRHRAYGARTGSLGRPACSARKPPGFSVHASFFGTLPDSAYVSQHGMAAVASLKLSISLRTRSFFMALGGSPRWRGRGRPEYVRLSKRHSPYLPGVNSPGGGGRGRCGGGGQLVHGSDGSGRCGAGGQLGHGGDATAAGIAGCMCGIMRAGGEGCFYTCSHWGQGFGRGQGMQGRVWGVSLNMATR